MNEQQLPPLPESVAKHDGGVFVWAADWLPTRNLDYFTADQMHAYARAALAANVPSGWKLTLVEPTPEMVKAGASEAPLAIDAAHVYRSMLAAAPAHQVATTNANEINGLASETGAQVATPAPSPEAKPEAQQHPDTQDAERYRWLRNESWAGYNISGGKPHVFTMDGAGNRRMMLAEEAMDEAVDKARGIGASGEASNGNG